MYQGAAPSGAAPIIFFRLEDSGQTFFHSTGIKERPEDVVRYLRQREIHTD